MAYLLGDMRNRLASLFLMPKLTYLMTDPSTYLSNTVFTMQAMQDIGDISTPREEGP